MFLNTIEHHILGHVDNRAFPGHLQASLVDRNRSNRDIHFFDYPGTYGIDISARAQVHDGICPELHSDLGLLQFFFDIHAILGGSQINIHLDAASLTDSFGYRVMDRVERYDHSASGYRSPQCFRVHSLIRGNLPYEVSDAGLCFSHYAHERAHSKLPYLIFALVRCELMVNCS